MDNLEAIYGQHNQPSPEPSFHPIGHELACKIAAPDGTCTNCGKIDISGKLCNECEEKVFGRELSPERERALASEVLLAHKTSHPAPIVDTSVPVFKPYDSRDYEDDEPQWEMRGIIFIRSTFPWFKIERY